MNATLKTPGRPHLSDSSAECYTLFSSSAGSQLRRVFPVSLGRFRDSGAAPSGRPRRRAGRDAALRGRGVRVGGGRRRAAGAPRGPRTAPWAQRGRGDGWSGAKEGLVPSPSLQAMEGIVAPPKTKFNPNTKHKVPSTFMFDAREGNYWCFEESKLKVGNEEW